MSSQALLMQPVASIAPLIYCGLVIGECGSGREGRCAKILNGFARCDNEKGTMFFNIVPFFRIGSFVMRYGVTVLRGIFSSIIADW